MLNCFVIEMPEKEGKRYYEMNGWGDFVNGSGSLVLLYTISTNKKDTIELFLNNMDIKNLNITNWKQAYKKGCRVLEIEICRRS